MSMKRLMSEGRPAAASACCALLLLAVLTAGCEKESAAPAPAVTAEGERLTLAEPDKATFLKTEAVLPDSGSELQLPGRLVWNEDRTVRLYPQLGGRVQKVLRDAGSTVTAGQTLATLWSADYGQAQADAHKADADRQQAEQVLERSRELHAAGVIADKDWQAAQADARRAQAEAARAGRRLATLGGDGDGSYALKSPMAGVVVERNVTPGMEFRPDQSSAPLFVITDPASLWLQLDAGEADLRWLKAGQRLALEVKHYPGERFPGVVRHVADFVDPASRTVKVRCEVPNADRRLKGEMFATASLPLPPGRLLKVPAQAVMLFGSRYYVLRDEGDGHYRRMEVQVGRDAGGWIEVDGELKPGDRVVSEGNLHLAKYLKAPAAK